MHTIQNIISMLFISLSCVPCHAETPSSINVGVLASLTDEWATIGDNIVKGARLAAQELNQSGGVRGSMLNLVIEDTHEANSGAQAVTAYRSLRQRGIQYFIGPTGTPAGLALAPILRKDSPVIILTPSVGVRDFSDSGPNVFNTRGVDEASSKLTARYAVSRNWKTAGVLASQQPWESSQGQAFKTTFEQLGGKVVFYDEPLSNSDDLRTPLTQLIEAKPEVVFLSNLNRIALASRQLKLLGYQGPLLTIPLDASSVKNANGALEGAVYASFIAPSEAFTEKFNKAYGAKPDYGADAAYDAVLALGFAMRQSTGNDIGSVLRELSKVRFNGAAGEFSLDEGRIAKRVLIQWKVAGLERLKLE